MSEEKEKNSEKTGGGTVIGVILGLIALVAVLILLCVGVPTAIATYFWEDTRQIEGEASAYDPIAAFDTVSAYAGEGAELISIDAYYVHSDGTVDLTAEYFPHVDYEFYRIAEDGSENDVPLGAPNSTAHAEVLYEKVNINVWRPYQMRSVSSSNVSYSYFHLGMQREIDEASRDRPAEAIPAPRCSFADLWATAIEKGNAPADAVAIIQYNSEGYYFYINDTDVRLNFDVDCNRTLH